MLIYITEKDEIHPRALNLLKQKGHSLIFSVDRTNQEKIDVLFIRTYTHATKQYLDQFPNVKYILRAGVGLDNIDVEESKRRNIRVINAPGSNANAVAEYVIGIIILSLRNIPIHMSLLKEEKWREKRYMGYEVKGKIIGLVGCGAIGRLITKKLQHFEVEEILGYDPYLDTETLAKSNIKKCELNELLTSGDIISLHLPLTVETKNLISQKQLSKMRRSALLINTSRGGIINEMDLIAALQNKTIYAAALDVFEHEPNIRRELLSFPNFIATPHIAGYTYEADEEMSMMPVIKFIKFTQ